MFYDQNLYPTPAAVIDDIMTGEDVSGCTILEPSAGTGNICRWLHEHGAASVKACEIDPLLYRSLSVLPFVQMVGGDFLKVTPAQVGHLDYIVMNPPFMADERHLLHAWAIAPAGCTIVAIMPTHSVKADRWANQTRQQLADLIKLHGHCRDLGAAFEHSERPTSVLVSCVKLYKEGRGESEFSGYFFDQQDTDQEGTTAGLMTYDAVRDLVNRYKRAVEQFDAVQQMSEYINSLTNFGAMMPQKNEGSHAYASRQKSQIQFGAYWTGGDKDHPQRIDREVFKCQLKKDAWRFVFSLLDLDHMATHKLREQIDQFVEQQSATPFTMRNIYRMLQIVVMTNGNRMAQCIADAFELICSFSADNYVCVGESWKTNKSYKVNRRFIVPNLVSVAWTGGGIDTWGHYEKFAKMDDVLKALQHLTGTQGNTNLSQLIKEGFTAWGQWFDCGEWFRARCYKKGTVHFEFRDEKVLELFNATAARALGGRNIGTQK